MNTLFLVMAEFETAEIPLERLCEKHFGMDLPQAKRKAASHDLPVPFYRKAGQKSPWHCSAADWAEYLDNQRVQARNEWKRMKRASN